MKFNLRPTRVQLKVFSAVCSNFVVVWLVAFFGTRDFLALTANFILAIVSWYLAVKAETLAEENYD